MTPTVVQHAGTEGTTLPFENPVVPGSLLLAFVGTGGNGVTWTASDNVNGAWAAIPSTTNNAGAFSITAFFFDGTAAGTPTLTVVGGNADIGILEVAGTARPVVFEGAAAANGSSTTPAVNVTTLTDGAIVIGADEGFQLTPVAGAGFNQLDQAGFVSFVDEYVVKTSRGTISVAFTQSTGGWAVAAFGVKPADPPFTPRRMPLGA